ncbi:MAG TPA: DCC1-like thiol-disulfide oxidoreductase family protein [Vicinamibacterales bacterium]|nr:DCC1-like thiol-disulfide oxidoreductase family protein [Vicinamibacterales bacterium]
MGGRHLILYDGVCGLCNRLTQFVIRHDERAAFDFAALQSDIGRSFLVKFGLNPNDIDTFAVVAEYKTPGAAMLTKSRASMFVLRTLGWPWRAFTVLGALGRTVGDRLYDLVAKNRYRVFGRYESCIVPSAEIRKRFIDA